VRPWLYDLHHDSLRMEIVRQGDGDESLPKRGLVTAAERRCPEEGSSLPSGVFSIMVEMETSAERTVCRELFPS
jgi:hypothetical protein